MTRTSLAGIIMAIAMSTGTSMDTAMIETTALYRLMSWLSYAY